MQEIRLPRPAGGVLAAYDAGGSGGLVALWHGGSPNTGRPPTPLVETDPSFRWIGADRPGYGGTTRDPSASVADVVADALAFADALEVEQLVVLGHSGGGPRALACAALAPDRVLAAVAISSPAPPGVPDLDRFAGMAPGIQAEQRAVAQGEAALRRAMEAEFDPSAFTDGDLEALDGPWAWFPDDVAAATADGDDGFVDDLLSAGRPWGFDLGSITRPVLVVHGAADRMVPVQHGRWLAEHVPDARLRVVDGAGHIDVLAALPEVLQELRAVAS